MKNILGINRVHNAAIALVTDGKLDLHIENERLSNIKYDAYPFHALSKLPDYTEKVDEIGLAGVGKVVPVEYFQDSDVYTTFVSHLNKQYFNADRTVYDFWQNHHLLHAACAFYNSGFNEAVCVIEDGMGSEYHIDDRRFMPGTYGRESSSVFTAKYPAEFSLVDKTVVVPFECSLVLEETVKITASISAALAFQKTAKQFKFHELDAGKVMGMASYGVEDFNIPDIYIDGEINKELFSVADGDLRKVFLNVKNYPYLDTDDFQIQANFARELQLSTQENIRKHILNMVEKTSIKNVCLSGGFFLNCVANYEFLKDLPSDIKLYVEPVSSDAGTSIGAAKLLWHINEKDFTVRQIENIYNGLDYSYSKEDILKKITTETVVEVDYNVVAELLSNKKIVAMYQGRSESGPRALGNRSILYDPRDPAGKDHVNKVKQREWFRPFAGTVLHEKTNDWFDMRGLKESPYMMFAVDVLKDQQVKIPAITHVDGTCRVQTVTLEQNLHFYNLIKAFEKITDVPILFNTSFNLAGNCIVETINDALETLKNSDIDFLYLPEHKLLISK
jgi:carbamoyltransferase